VSFFVTPQICLVLFCCVAVSSANPVSHHVHHLFRLFLLLKALPNQLQIDYAISREMKNAQGGKLYVQDALAQQADQLLERLQGGANIYFCGLKGMMPGILEALEDVCESKGLDFGQKLKEWQANHQWHVEVY
jgi:ferredoxin--NADP+ reductase